MTTTIPHCRLKLLSFLRRTGKVGNDKNTVVHDGIEYVVRDAQVLGHRAILERVDGNDIDRAIVDEIVGATGEVLTKADLIARGSAVVLADKVLSSLKKTRIIAPALLTRPNVAFFREELEDEHSAYDADEESELFRISQHIQLLETLEINAEYSLADKTGQLIVIDNVTGRLYLRKEFSAMIANRKIKVPNKFNEKTGKVEWKILPSFVVWLGHPARATYDDLVFAPEGRNSLGQNVDLARNFNIWVPPVAQAKQGDWPLIREHIRLIVCDGDERSFEYLMNWLAHLVQRPWEKPGVAVVLMSPEQGTGKGTFTSALVDLLGDKWARVFFQSDHIVGRFAAYEKPPMLAIGEEAIFSGSTKDKNVLKAKITDPKETIELKNQTAFPVESFTRYIFNSNNENAVPIEPNDRRFFVLRVSNARVGDRSYFKSLHEQIADKSALEAMMFELGARDISKFEVRDFPNTQARMAMKAEMLDKDVRALADVLRAGEFEIQGTPETLNLHEPSWVDKQIVRGAFEQVCARYGERRASDMDIGKLLIGCGVVLRERNRHKQRGYEAGYQFASLQQARQNFAKHYNVDIGFVTPAEADDADSRHVFSKAARSVDEARRIVQNEKLLKNTGAFYNMSNLLSSLVIGTEEAGISADLEPSNRVHRISAYAVLQKPAKAPH